MPNPNDPDEAECKICHDSGRIPGTDRLCECTGMGDQPEPEPDQQERPSLSEVVARWRNSSATDPTWRTDYSN